MITPKLILKILPWFLLIVIVFTMYLTNYSLFSKKGRTEVIDSSVILKEVEQIGRLELVKYNFKEIFDYRQLSEGKLIGNSLLNAHNYNPDMNVILVASGEAVGCIDLTKLEISDIQLEGDTITIMLPAPELCYHKLDMENTRVFSFTNDSWWSRLFSDESEKTRALQTAYKLAERRIEEAALQSGILNSANEQAVKMLSPMLEGMTGKIVQISTAMPDRFNQFEEE
jgi:hypothetical protein